MFEYGHGNWYLSDRVLPQVEHEYPPTTVPTPPYLTVWLADFLTDDEIAWARGGYIVAGVPGTYSEFVQIHLQGCLVGRTVLLSFLKSNT